MAPQLLERPLEAADAKCGRVPGEQSEAVIVPVTIETTQLDVGKGRVLQPRQAGRYVTVHARKGQQHPEKHHENFSADETRVPKGQEPLAWLDVASREGERMKALTASGRRLSESLLRANRMSGSRWQGVETGQGHDTEALSEETESNWSVCPKL